MFLPAVSVPREADRRSWCIHNLRQIAQAVLNYESAFEVLPGSQNGYSPFTAILPFMEQGSIFDAINFEIPNTGPGSVPENAAIEAKGTSTFLCPSDVHAKGARSGSYAFNWGYGFLSGTDCRPGPFGPPERGATRLADVADGAANTVALSEWRGGVPAPQRDRIRSTFHLPLSVGFAGDFENFVIACESVDPGRAVLALPVRGESWMTDGLGLTAYTHALPPNRPTCRPAGDPIHGAWTASSEHPGGANVVFLDGHYSRVKDTVDRAVWRAISTRDGEESVPHEALRDQ